MTSTRRGRNRFVLPAIAVARRRGADCPCQRRRPGVRRGFPTTGPVKGPCPKPKTPGETTRETHHPFHHRIPIPRRPDRARSGTEPRRPHRTATCAELLPDYDQESADHTALV